MYQDKILTCKDCGEEFTFSASEQEFFAEKGFTNEPTRCVDCRASRRQNNNRGGRGGNRSQRQMYAATCAACGVETEVPFRPSGDRPVYCKDCFRK